MGKKVSRAQIVKDREVIKAITKLADYQPINSAYSLEALLQIDATMRAAEQAAAQVREDQKALDMRRQQVGIVENDTGLMLHEVVARAKAQLVAQYGADSYVMTAIGLKRTSEYKRPSPRAEA